MIGDIGLSIQLRRALHAGIAKAQHLGRATLVSTVEEIETIEPLDVFHRGQILEERFYWQPADRPSLVGLGAAYSMPYLPGERTERKWSDLLYGASLHGPERGATGPLLVGCLSFDATRTPTDLWRDTPLDQLILPRFLLTTGRETWLTINAVIGPGDNVDRLLVEISAQAETLLRGPLPPQVESNAWIAPNDEDGFRGLVANAVAAIQRGELQKVVAARTVLAHGVPSITTVLRRLRSDSPHSTTFAFARATTCFLGATPEWLVRLHNGEARVSGLAGTARRGRNEEEDRLLGEELLASEKNRREHALVLDMILDSLSDLAADVRLPSTPAILKLPTLQHLFTPISATTSGCGLLSLVERLHPTPAVAGFPRESAMQFLRAHEGLDRGAYAGPVGWMDRHGDGDVAVGIRSALLRDGGATLFAGCGIMADSDPESEYAESQLKLKPMIAALGAGDG